MDSKTMISASEIGDYVYCRRCWYFRLRGILPRIVTDQMISGAQEHSRLSSQIEGTETGRRLLIVIIVLAAVLLCLVLILILGVIAH